ncbi:hypothetical protein EI94DRAFT_277453 [Lactarius quietus]|nr:hypothetical protein EI94DRAFT_277453 [Lactarius quietus]
MHSNHSCASIQSRASDRLSIIQSQSYESLHSSLGKPKGNPKASHRQFGSGPSTDRLEGSSNVHASSGITGIYSCRWAESSASVVVEVENPSTESFPRSELVDSPTPEESYSIGSPTLHSSPASKPLNLPEESPQFTPTPSLILDLILPEHRILQMINSEQVPRYTKGVTVPHERRSYDISPLTTKFPHVLEHRDNGPGQGLPEVDCAPWEAATHPDGALYFFDEDRRLFTDTNMLDPVLRKRWMISITTYRRFYVTKKS